MNKYACTEDGFLDDVAMHQMEVVFDNGANRYVRFKNPKSTIWSFSLVTWPGYLCICGDVGTYVFRRLPDMFDFFRDKITTGPLDINPNYWGQKLEAIERNGGYKEYSPKKLYEAVKDQFDDLADGGAPELEKLWKLIVDEVIDREDGSEHSARQAVADFEYSGFKFDGFDEIDLKDYTHTFIWSLYAIVWGIRKYDALKKN